MERFNPSSVSAPFLVMSEQMLSSWLVEGLWGVRDWAGRPVRQRMKWISHPVCGGLLQQSEWLRQCSLRLPGP